MLYIVVVIAGMAAVLVDHFTSPSGSRSLSPEESAGDCASCPAAKK